MHHPILGRREREAQYDEKNRANALITKLKSIRERLISAFTSSIDELEPDPSEAPAPRLEQIREQQAEVKKLKQELEEGHARVREEIEALNESLSEMRTHDENSPR